MSQGVSDLVSSGSLPLETPLVLLAGGVLDHQDFITRILGVLTILLGLPFLIAALGFRRALRAFGFARRNARTVMRFGGPLLVIVGILQVSGAWAYLTGLLRRVAGYQPAL
ncbi:hypothetical protein [Streptomyces sp. TRM68367]|uniref:hypothetical protein n=1 Tax=Streptomyces sp. TRM68367 TaxID=2758415 RepID=UPI00165BDF65|nr:hypothetical protein [Streptomyces sp. TRM68367]MBC9723923.1 hypothetical protein [Streptomyces sp. TRM68367]